MTPSAAPADLLALLGALLGALAALGYGGLVLRVRRRQRFWPAHRSATWVLGCVLAAAGVSRPLTTGLMGGPAHMVGHLVLGMVAPLVLVLGAPVTLLLRALPVRSARRLSRVLRTRPIRLLSEPSVAALLDVGGLWLLYATPLGDVADAHPALYLLVHLHVLLAGVLLSAVLVGPDPLAHRRSTAHLVLVLALALAAHDVLAKWLYAHASGPEALAAQRGALVMYYGGDVVDLALAVLVCARWYRRTRPRASAGVAAVSPARAAGPVR